MDATFFDREVSSLKVAVALWKGTYYLSKWASLRTRPGGSTSEWTGTRCCGEFVFLCVWVHVQTPSLNRSFPITLARVAGPSATLVRLPTLDVINFSPSGVGLCVRAPAMTQWWAACTLAQTMWAVGYWLVGVGAPRTLCFAGPQWAGFEMTWVGVGIQVSCH